MNKEIDKSVVSSLEHVSCDLCGNAKTAFFMRLADRHTGEIFTLVKCEMCGLIFLDPRPNQDEISKYYPENYECFFSDENQNSKLETWHLSRSNAWKLNYLRKNTIKSGKLLDIGSGTGDFLKVCQDQKWEVTGIELVAKAAEIARKKHNLHIITGHFENVELPLGYYDVITLWDVLEHLPSPSKAFARIHQLLKNQGWAIFSIPNLSSFDRHLFGPAWIGWDVPRHFYSFSESHIETLAKNTGFRVIRKDCITGAKGAFWLSVDLWDSNLRKYILKLKPSISMMLWPYRQISYLLKRGPIITYLIQKV